MTPPSPFPSPTHKFAFTSVCPLPPPAVEINQNWEVVYQDTSVYGVVGKAVILECGPTLPDMYIWSFTKPGTEAIKAVVYDLGKGTRIQQLAQTLGQLTVISNSAAVSIEKLPLAAHGLFTCQAFYDIEKEPKVYYYYVHLTVRGKTSCALKHLPPSASSLSTSVSETVNIPTRVTLP